MLTASIIRNYPIPAPGKLKKMPAGHDPHRLIHQDVKGKPAYAWRFKSRLAGKESSLSFGPYPDVSIAAAKERAAEARAGTS